MTEDETLASHSLGNPDSAETTMSEAARRPALQQRVAEAILDGAAEIFVLQGEQASMNDVAEAAGVARATVYRYFPNRHWQFGGVGGARRAVSILRPQTITLLIGCEASTYVSRLGADLDCGLGGRLEVVKPGGVGGLPGLRGCHRNEAPVPVAHDRKGALEPGLRAGVVQQEDPSGRQPGEVVGEPTAGKRAGSPPS
jgi:Bacterial regulatory proteins, tetR family